MSFKRTIIIFSVILLTVIITFFGKIQNHFFNSENVTKGINQEFESEENEFENESEQIVDMLKWQYQRLKDPVTNRIPEGIRNKELEFAKNLPNSKTTRLQKGGQTITTSSNWILRGPNNQGGRTKAIAVDVNNENIILAGAADGGIWRSTDKGQSWTPTTDPSLIQNVNCLVQNTRPGKTNNWYYGTGELKANVLVGNEYIATFLGNGIYKSTDNGISWNPIESTLSNSANKLSNPFQIVWNVQIDTTVNDKDILYVATSLGILKSEDGGESWKYLLKNSSQNSGSGYYTDLAIASNNGIFAAMNYADSAGVYYSSDGEHFTNITPQDWPQIVYRILLAAAPSDSNTVYMLANTPGVGRDGFWHYGDSRAEDDHSLWKYNLEQNKWTNITQSLPPWVKDSGGIQGYSSQKSYDMVLKVKPDDKDYVILGGLNLYRTTDGFETQLNFPTDWIGGYSNENVGAKTYPNHHSDQHDVYFLPSNPDVMYSAHDGGIGYTNDVTADSVQWISMNEGYVTTQFYSVALDHATANNPVIIGGMQDNSTRYTISPDPLSDWIEIGSGDGATAAVADGTEFIYYSSQNGNVSRYADDVGSLDIKPKDASGFLFVTPYILDPTNTNVMFLGAGSEVWRNSNLAGIPDTNSSPPEYFWSSFEYKVNGRVTALAKSKSNSGVLYVGTSEGNVYRVDNSSNLNSYFNNVTGNNLPHGYVTSIAVDPNNAANVMIAYSNYDILSIFVSDNGGQSWQNISGNLEVYPDGSGPGPSIRTVKILPVDGTYVFLAGTSVGLFATTKLNGFQTEWIQQAPEEIGNVIVESIDVRSIDGTIIVGTFGKGVYSNQLGVTSIENNDEVVKNFNLDQNYPNPFNPTTNIEYQVSRYEEVTLKVYDMLGQEVATLVNKQQKAGKHKVEFNGSDLSSGLYIYTIKAGDFYDSKKMLLLK